MATVAAHATKRDAKSLRQVDRYARTLGLVFVDGLDVRKLLITMGLCQVGR